MINVYSPTISSTLGILKYRRYYRLHEGTLIRKTTNWGMIRSVANRTLIGTLMVVTVYYDIQISYTMAKRTKGDAEIRNDRSVSYENFLQTRQNECKRDSQFQQYYDRWCSSKRAEGRHSFFLFSFSAYGLLLSFVSSLRTLFFLPVVSVSAHDSTSTLDVAIIHPLPASAILPTSPHHPLNVSLRNFSLSLLLHPAPSTSPLFCLLPSSSSSIHPLLDYSFSFSLVPDLFYSRDVIAACIFHETNLEAVCSSLPIHLSVHPTACVSVCSSTQPNLALFVASPTFNPFAHSLFLMLCVVINLYRDIVICSGNLQCKSCALLLHAD